MQKIWISGANGQLGKAIFEMINTEDYELLTTDIDDVDITNIDDVLLYGEMNRPDVIINCSAMTQLQECEANPSKAFHINALGARNLSIVAQKLQAKLVHLSSDDVFDGTCDKPYTEYDTTNPQTVYGKSKDAGEKYVKEFTQKHFIIRSTWVYGQGNNFVNRFLKKLDSGDVLHIANDQIGSPTSAKDLARFILKLIQTNEYGTFHATCTGSCTRYEFAQEILKLTGKSAALQPTTTESSDFSTARPPYAVLDNFVLSMVKNHTFPTWQESLAEYIACLSE